ncbi:MAG TPA: hypothetical protein VHE37_07485 [Nevskiaceae bacterium]|nr:hypothetical protein [Nevskiaceae bacterium]
MNKHLSALLLLLASSCAFAQATYDGRNIKTATAPLTALQTQAAKTVLCNSGGSSASPTACTAQTLGSMLGLEVNADSLGAAGDNTTDDSSIFTTLLGNPFGVTSPGKVYRVKNLVNPGNQLDCRGSTLKAAAGASWVIELNGLGAQLINCTIQDDAGAGYYTLTSTTLSGTASPGATSITVASATGMAANKPIFITLDCGMDFPTAIDPSYVSGTTIPLLDPIPNCATAAAVASGGTGYANGNNLIETGGEGAPVTLSVTNTSGGVIQSGGLTILSPGFQTSVPSNPVALQKGSGTGATANFTWAGAASGKAVRTAWGLVKVDKAKYALLDNLHITNAPVGMQFMDTGTGTAPSFHTIVDTVTNINDDSNLLAGIVLLTKTSQTTFHNVQLHGVTSSPNFGVVGVYQECHSTGGTPCGGNYFTNLTALGYEIGQVGQSTQLAHYVNAVFDTVQFYGGVYFNPVSLLFGGDTQFSFTTVDGSTGSTGVGLTLAGTGSDVVGDSLTLRKHICGIWIGSNVTKVAIDQDTEQLNTYLCGPNDFNQRDAYLGGAQFSRSLHANPGTLNGDAVYTSGFASGSGAQIGSETSSSNSPFYLSSVGTGCVVVKPGNTTKVQHCPNYSLYTARIDFTGNTPGSLTGCGTSPSITGNNKAGRITIGTGGATACTFTFDNSPNWASQPICHANNSTTGAALGAKAPAGNLTSKLEIDGTMNAGDVVTYMCVGIQ